jgi:hypothetical protein
MRVVNLPWEDLGDIRLSLRYTAAPPLDHTRLGKACGSAPDCAPPGMLLASLPRIGSRSKGNTMLGAIAPYLMGVSAMLFAGLSALTLIRTVKHFDPPEPAPAKSTDHHAAA